MVVMNAKQLVRLTLFPAILLFCLISGAWGSDLGEITRSAENLSPGITNVGHQIYSLHMWVLWVCIIIGGAVFAVMFYSILVHRKSLDYKAADFHEHTGAEIAWTLIPILILIVIAFPASKTLISIYDTSEADLDVVITGYQWKWKYEYLGEGVSFFSTLRTPQNEIHNVEPKGENYLLEVDKPLVIPAHKKVRFLITANDVIHSWWVPDLAVKKDAIPGFINESWAKAERTGVVRGQCAELCGKDHGFMPIVVNVVEPAEFDTWLGEKKKEAAAERELMSQHFTLEELVERGEKVYQTSCAACHGATGAGVPGAFPALKGSPIATGAMEEHLSRVVHGVPGTAMAAYGAQLSEVDLAAVITYERNAWGNNMGDMLQPIDVARFKKAE